MTSPLDCKESQPVHSEGDQPWDFFGRTDAKAETPVLWPPYAKSWLIGKDSVAGRDWGQEEKGTTEDEMVGWHHWLNGHGFGWTPGVGDGQGGLACCGSWGCKELDTTERLNCTELNGFCVIHLNFLILLAHVCIPSNREYHFVFNVLEFYMSKLHNLIFCNLLPIPPLMMIHKGISSHFHCSVDFHCSVYNLFKHFVHWWGCFRFLTRIMRL